MSQNIEIEDWGTIDYNEAWERQREIEAVIKEKRDKHVLVFCEHPTVITIGKSGSGTNVIMSEDFLKKLGVQVVYNDRGGDATLHNPNQLVGYPIFNLSAMKEDLHWFLREIEESIIELIATYGIKGGRVKGMTGVWVDGERKICAMGLKCSRWVTSHGFALNVNNDLSEFSFIVPCGIVGKDVTSIEKETGGKVDFEDLKERCAKIFTKNFNL